MKRFFSAIMMFVIGAALMFTGCQKNITIALPPIESQIVVEGHIETGQGAYVVLTRSTGYFSPLDTQAVLNSIVHNAVVIVSDGIHTDTLPYYVDVFPSPNNYLYTTYLPWYYKKLNPTVIGQVGGTYNLTILADGKKLTSTTTLPVPVRLDSAWFKLTPPSDSLGFIWGHLSDPGNEQNFYRWFAKRLHKDKKFLPPFGSCFDDKFINGTSFSFSYNRGKEPNSTAPDDLNAEDGYFKIRDTVVVKFCSIDYGSARFYESYQLQAANAGNPFGSPSNVKSNINGGLGVWGGYSTTFDTVIDRPH
jgi:hypothetical protein